MPYKLVKQNSFNYEDIILFLLLLTLIYYMFCAKNMRENEQFTDDEIKKNISIDKLPCSRKCCAYNQWPVDFFEHDKNAIPTNLMCNGGDGGGCVCLTKEALKILKNRGIDKK